MQTVKLKKTLANNYYFDEIPTQLKGPINMRSVTYSVYVLLIKCKRETLINWFLPPPKFN